MTLLYMSISAGVLILLILLLRAAAFHFLPKRLFVSLWGIVLLRLLLPVSIPLPFGITFPVTEFLESRISAFDETASVPAYGEERQRGETFSVSAGNEPDSRAYTDIRRMTQETEPSLLAAGDWTLASGEGKQRGEPPEKSIRRYSSYESILSEPWGENGDAGGILDSLWGEIGDAGGMLGGLWDETANAGGIQGSVRSGTADAGGIQGSLSGEAVKLLWLLGAAGLSLYFAFTGRREHRILRESLPLPAEGRKAICDTVYAEGKNRCFCRLAGRMRLRVSDRVVSPLVLGIFRPQIIFPKDMAANIVRQGECAGSDGISCIILHELVHIRRKDNLWKIISLLALCLHWFNPLVWVMYIFFNRDLELSCDECVIRLLGEDQKETYALALISMAEYQCGRILTGSGFGKKAVRERVAAIMKYRKMNAVGVGCAVALIMLSMTVFGEKEAKGTKKAAAGLQTDEPAQSAAEFLEQRDVRINFYQFAEYVKMRLVYDRRNNRLLYEDQPVGYFKDEVSENVYYEGYLDTRYDRNAIGILVHRDEDGEFLRFRIISMADAAAEAAATDTVREKGGVKVYDMQDVLDWNQSQTSPLEICKEVIAEYEDFPRCTVTAERDRMGAEIPGVLYVRVIDGNEWGEENADDDMILRVQNEVMSRCWELREVCVAWEYLTNPEAYPAEQKWEMRAITGRMRGTSDSLVI